MNSLDLTLLLIIGVSLMVSTFRGAVREIFSLGGVIAGFILASHYYTKMSLGVLRLTSYPEINNIISFLVIFIFSAVLISFIGGMFSHAVNKSGFKVLNTLLGTFIGAVKGVLIASLVLYALLVFLPADSGMFVKSKTFPYAVRLSKFISPIGPTFFREEFDKKLNGTKGSEKAGQPPSPTPPRHLNPRKDVHKTKFNCISNPFVVYK
jgi:membrane protein required for colicin V production